MDVKTQLHEGMKIALIDNQEKEYTLIKSSNNDEMYGVYQKHIIKLNDLDADELDNKWICTNLLAFKDLVKCIEIKDSKPISFEDFCIYSFAEDVGCFNDEFVSVDIKISNMTQEEYLKSKNYTYYFDLREKIVDFYEKQEAFLK